MILTIHMSHMASFLKNNFQIAVTPTLMNTTQQARYRFNPIDRGCYVEGERPLKYLPSEFYRYEMSNCLFEAAYERILEECNCTPSFHQLAHHKGICTGPGLTCMNKILNFIGKTFIMAIKE